MSAMWYNEYHTILNSGLNADDLTLFFFSRLGLNFPEDGIYCMEETLREDPELCEAFVQCFHSRVGCMLLKTRTKP